MATRGRDPATSTSNDNATDRINALMNRINIGWGKVK